MKIIKKVLILLIIILVIIIYLTNKDTKIYYVSLGDGISRGINENNKISYGYSDYIKNYLFDIDKLEFYTKQFSNKDKRTTDIINADSVVGVWNPRDGFDSLIDDIMDYVIFDITQEEFDNALKDMGYDFKIIKKENPHDSIDGVKYYIYQYKIGDEIYRVWIDEKNFVLDAYLKY